SRILILRHYRTHGNQADATYNHPGTSAQPSSTPLRQRSEDVCADQVGDGTGQKCHSLLPALGVHLLSHPQRH
ncbi:unnamed protein product, partial [Protopolystoma xenopodis]